MSDGLVAAAAHGGKAEEATRRVGLFSLVVIGFFWVSGGIYGNEELVGAAPPLVLILVTSLVPLLFSLPAAVLTAELATAFPSDGGQVAWVDSALGTAVGLHNAYWLWLTNLIDAAVYPQMMVQYIRVHLPLNEAQERWLMLGIVAVVAFVSLLGIDWVSRSQGIMFVLTVGPCLLFIGLGLPKLEPTAWVSTEGTLDPALLLSWCLWLYSGFAWLGLLAGEVSTPRRTYTGAIVILLPLVTLLNVMPFLVALSIDPNLDHYEAGYFEQLTHHLAGDWLEAVFAVGANAALLGLYHSQTLAADTILAAVAQLHANAVPRRLRQLTAASEADDRRSGSCGTRMVLRLRRLLLTPPNAGSIPRVMVLINAIIIALMLTLHYQALVEIEMMLYSLSHLLFFIAFIALRVQRPDAPRPFRVPGGVLSISLMLVVPTGILIATLVINCLVLERLLLCGGAVLLGVLVQLAAVALTRRRGCAMCDHAHPLLDAQPERS